MFTNYYENKILNWILGAEAMPVQANWYLGLLKSAPQETGATGGSECTGAGYARLVLPNTTAIFPSTTTSVKSLANSAAFADAGNDWGDLSHWGLFDAAVAGNLCMYGALNAVTHVSAGDAARVPAGTTGMALGLD